VSFADKFRSFLGRPWQDYVLVIGSAHIDVFADYDAADQDKMDKIGTVRYAVGGTGYNIAINLGQLGVPVALLTLIRRNSLPSTWILERLESSGVDTRFVDPRDRTNDSGFVAIRKDHQLETAVIASVMSAQPLNVARVTAAIENARLVAFDCNLPTIWAKEPAKAVDYFVIALLSHESLIPNCVLKISSRNAAQFLKRDNYLTIKVRGNFKLTNAL
jgi:sugar/nucleoside kinase (ribokinase family)